MYNDEQGLLGYANLYPWKKRMNIHAILSNAFLFNIDSR